MKRVTELGHDVNSATASRLMRCQSSTAPWRSSCLVCRSISACWSRWFPENLPPC
ncbi:MAG: hypothetical protein MZV63_58295 [Marinilabiliales bacterium]|nr:hypothetical protein [Marinilabiliales bacterium]